MAYAGGTTVSTEKSKMEIERTLTRYGADAFGYATDSNRAVIQFRASGRFVRFVLPLPPLSEFAHDRNYRSRNKVAQQNAYDAEHRRRWRALALAIKAKLEVVESGIASFEEEFISQIVLPDGSSVGEHVLPMVAEAYETGDMPKMRLQIGAGSA